MKGDPVTPAHHPDPKSDPFNPSLADLAAILWQRRGIVALTFVLVGGILVAGLSQWQPSFRAVAEIGLSPAINRASDGQGRGGFDRPRGLSAQEIETAMVQLRSQDILDAAVAALRSDPVAKDIFAPNTPAHTGGDDRAINRLRSGLDTARIGNAAVIEVGFTSRDPAISQTVLQTVIDSFVWARETRLKSGLRRQGAEAATQLLQAQAVLRDQEHRLNDWRQDAGVLDDQEGQMMLDRIYALDEQAELIGRDVVSARFAVDRFAKADGLDDLMNIADVAQNPAVAQLFAQFKTRQDEFTTLDQRYGPKHPMMQGRQAELDQLRRDLMVAAKRVGDQLSFQLHEARAKLAEINRRRDDWQEKLAARHSRIEGQAALMRAVDLAKQDVVALGQHAQSLQRELASFQGDVTVLRNAQIPAQAVFPTRRDLGLMAVVIALFAAAIAGLVRHYMDRTVGDDFDPESQLGIPLFARIPMVHSGAALRPDRHGSLSHVEAVGHLAVLMRILAPSNSADGPMRAQVIAIASPVSGDGKSHIAAALAHGLADMGGAVLLLDGDMHDPGQPYGHERPEKMPDGDLTACLSGQCDLDAAIEIGVQQGQPDRLGARMPVPGTIATGLIENGFARLIADLRPRYRHIIIDTPPILSVADGLAMMGHADTHLMVARCGHSNRSDIDKALAGLRNVGIVPDGMVLNGARPRNAYGYGARAETVQQEPSQ
ncbi:hypothetical protein LPB41_20225 [Thalassospira sp. MA62]|nr:hypothetical protein [Thalassospira sp. MA62]